MSQGRCEKGKTPRSHGLFASIRAVTGSFFGRHAKAEVPGPKSENETLSAEIAAERDTYRHAYETTKADRDRIQLELDEAKMRIAFGELGLGKENLENVCQSFPATSLLARYAFVEKCRWVDFIIPGLPKSGTSFIHSLLRAHPEVYLGETLNKTDQECSSADFTD